jgi:hypothetical protein
MKALKTQVKRIERRVGKARPDVADRSPWDWYAESCPCGLPPGQCALHPRARPTQRPPGGDWRVWAYVAGRGAGKTRAGAGWIQERVERGTMKRGCLIAPTMADIRDVMVEGPSGLLAVAPPWCRPRFQPSKRRVTWPNGARAVCLSGEEPERARGFNFDTIWADELACWQRAELTWDLAMLALRAGTNPQAMVTTTPRRVAVLRRIVDEPATVRTTDPTYANQAHLAPEFLRQIAAKYENTRLGRQEIYAEYERVFGSRVLARWPQHLVLDGLDTLELLLETGNLIIHPRCEALRSAFQNYRRQRRGGQWTDFPADGHPEEDLIDALRGGVRDALPQGNRLALNLPRVHAARVF